MVILPPTITGPPPASSPGAPSRPISSRWRLPSHRSTVTALLRPNQSLILHRPGHHSRRRNSTPPLSPLASNLHRAALPSRLPHPPRFRALALVGRLPSAPANTCVAPRASDKPAQERKCEKSIRSRTTNAGSVVGRLGSSRRWSRPARAPAREIPQRRAFVQMKVDATQLAGPIARQMQRRLPQRLERYAGIRRGTSQIAASLDQRHLFTEVGRLRSALLSRSDRISPPPHPIHPHDARRIRIGQLVG